MAVWTEDYRATVRASREAISENYLPALAGAAKRQEFRRFLVRENNLDGLYACLIVQFA